MSLRLGIAGIITIALSFSLEYWGSRVEYDVRNWYRASVCRCDTLRPSVFLDDAGVPLVNYYSTLGTPVGVVRNPTEVAQFALKRKLTRERGLVNENEFWTCAKWLRDSGMATGDTIWYPHHYPRPAYELHPGWHSAITQGLALSVLSEAFLRSGDSLYLKTAFRVRNSFLCVDSAQKIYTMLDHGGIWFDEYPSAASPMVLNGMLDAMLCLHAFGTQFNDTVSNTLFEKAHQALIYNLWKYNRGGEGSWYHLPNQMADSVYHRIHMQHLENIYAIHPSDTTKHYLQKWASVPRTSWWLSTIQQPNLTKTMLSFFFCIMALVIWGIALKVGFKQR